MSLSTNIKPYISIKFDNAILQFISVRWFNSKRHLNPMAKLIVLRSGAPEAAGSLVAEFE